VWCDLDGKDAARLLRLAPKATTTSHRSVGSQFRSDALTWRPLPRPWSTSSDPWPRQGSAVGHDAYPAVTGQWRPPSMYPCPARKQPCGKVPGFHSAGQL
jgi:hypothetical protein